MPDHKSQVSLRDYFCEFKSALEAKLDTVTCLATKTEREHRLRLDKIATECSSLTTSAIKQLQEEIDTEVKTEMVKLSADLDQFSQKFRIVAEEVTRNSESIDAIKIDLRKEESEDEPVMPIGTHGTNS